MRILHVIGSLDPDTGGPAVICASLAAAQSAMGHEVAIAADVPANRRSAVEGLLRSLPHAERVTLLPLAPAGPTAGMVARFGPAALREAVDRCDVAHLHGVWESHLLHAARRCRARGTPYIVLLNGMLDPWSLAQSRWKKRIALALGWRRMLSEATALHLGNRDEETLIAPLGLKSPGVIVPNGVFLEQVEPLPAKGSFRSKVAGLGEARYVLFLSRLHYKKGLDYLAEAFALAARELPGVHLVVAGPDGGERGALEARIAAAGLGDRTHLVGPVYGREKFAAMVDASCFCLPSRQEGFSMAITEALAAGLPVVISENCHFPEVAEAGAGCVVRLDAANVARAMVEVMGDESRRSAMSSRAAALVRERYTWPVIAARTIAIYEQALGSRGQGR